MTVLLRRRYELLPYQGSPIGELLPKFVLTELLFLQRELLAAAR